MVELPTNRAFIVEIWSLYAVGMMTLILRFFVRLRTVGLRKFEGDDILAVVLIGLHTIDIVTVHIAHYTGTNAEAAVYAEIAPLTDDDIAQFEFGSKIEFVAWFSYVNLIWCLKGSMLFFYRRVAMGNTHPRLIPFLAIVCFTAYLVVNFTIIFGCWPIQKNWQVLPDPGEHCTIRKQNVWVSTTCNVITDLAILSIPIPLLGLLNVPFWKKVFIGVLLCSGVFIIAAAITRAVVTLSANPSATTVNSWSVRETIVGLLAINLPILRPLFTFKLWKRDLLMAEQANIPRDHDNQGPIRRAIRKPFDTLFSLDSILNTGRSKTTFSSVLQVEDVHANQDTEAARPGRQLHDGSNGEDQPNVHTTRQDG